LNTPIQPRKKVKNFDQFYAITNLHIQSVIPSPEVNGLQEREPL